MIVDDYGSEYNLVEEFLKQSDDDVYGALRSMLARLEDPSTRSEALIFLSDLQKCFTTKEACDHCFKTYHFQIKDIFLDQYKGIVIAVYYVSLTVLLIVLYLLS